MEIKIELTKGDQIFSLITTLVIIFYLLCSQYGAIILGWFIPAS